MRWWLSGVALMLLFMVIQLPVAFVLMQLPPLSVPVDFYQTKGTLWHGDTCAKTPIMQEDPCVTWHWQPAEILKGDMVWSVSAELERAKIDMLANASFNGWQLKGGLRVEDAVMMPSWAQMMPAGATPAQKNISFQGAW